MPRRRTRATVTQGRKTRRLPPPPPSPLPSSFTPLPPSPSPAPSLEYPPEPPIAGFLPSDTPTKPYIALVLFLLCDPLPAAHVLDSPRERLRPYIDVLRFRGVWHCGDGATDEMFSDILDDDDEFLSLLKQLCPCFEELHRSDKLAGLVDEISKWANDFDSQKEIRQFQEENYIFACDEMGGRWRKELIALFSDIRFGGGRLGWPEYLI